MHQSNVTIMFNNSGIGVSVECMHGLLHVRASAPFSLFVIILNLIIILNDKIF